MGKPTAIIFDAKRDAFLAALATTGMVTTAAAAAGLERRAVYRWRDSDPRFAEAWDDALEQVADRIEAEAIRRAVEGVEEPVYQGGQLVGTRIVYSDSLLGKLLNAKRPSQYRERTEITGANGGPIVTVDETKKAARVAALVALAQARKAGDDFTDLV